MKNFIIFIIFTALIFSGCGKIDEAKKAMNAVKQVAEDTADSFKEMEKDEYDNVKHNYKLVVKIKEELDI